MAGSPSASWEEIVDRVSVKSNYYNVADAALGWREIFRYLAELQDGLKTLATGSESWTGGAADGFRDHLDGFIKNLDDLQHDHERIVPGLEALASHLRTAVNTIPIPSWMMAQLEDAQAAYQMGDEVPGYEPGSFGHFYLEHVMGGAYSKIPLVGSAWKALEGWVNDNEQVAKQAYAQLQSNYGAETANIPAGRPVNPPSASDVPQFNPDTFHPSGPRTARTGGPPPARSGGRCPG